jgi:hypothetical protein
VSARLAVDDRDIHDELLLEQIKQAYGAYYDIGRIGGEWYSFRLTGGPLLTAGTLGDLAAAIWADWTGR